MSQNCMLLFIFFQLLKKKIFCIRGLRLRDTGFFHGNDNVPRSIVVTEVQLCEYTEIMDLYTLVGEIIWDVSYILVKLL